MERINAGDLQKKVLAGETTKLDKLPFVGNVEQSPFVRGWSHMLSGSPKSGKTELTSRLVADWSREGLKVLYFTEEPKSVWEARLEKMPDGLDNIDIVFTLGVVEAQIREEIKKSDVSVVVIDTIRLLGIKDENDNAVIHKVVAPFVATCREGEKTLVLIHHLRKAAGEYGEGASGGHAFVGIVDVALELHRVKGSPNRRLVKGLSRVFAVDDVLVERQEDGQMRFLGDPNEVTMGRVKERVLEYVDTTPRLTRDILEAMDEPKPSLDTLTWALNGLASTRAIQRDPPVSEGRKPGKSYRWFKEAEETRKAAGTATIAFREIDNDN